MTLTKLDLAAAQAGIYTILREYFFALTKSQRDRVLAAVWKGRDANLQIDEALAAGVGQNDGIEWLVEALEHITEALNAAPTVLPADAAAKENGV